MEQAMRDAVDALYETFPVGPLGFVPTGCTYCHPATDFEAWAKPTRQLPSDLLAPFALEVDDHIDQFGAVWRHLFPAVAEALAHNHLHVDEGLVLRRVWEAGFAEWSAEERQATWTFLIRWFEHLLVRDPLPAGPVLIDVLQGVSWLSGEVESWLELWNEHKDTASVEHTLDLFYSTYDVVTGAADEVHAGWGSWPAGSASALRRWAAQDWVAAQLLARSAHDDLSGERARHYVNLLISSETEGLTDSGA